jgi:hypothetical protein
MNLRVVGAPSAESPIADQARTALETALAAGAVAIMIVFETPDGTTEVKSVPSLSCIHRGLALVAIDMAGGERE